MRVILIWSHRNVVTTSINDMDDVSAAPSRMTKNTSPKKVPNGIAAKILGRVMNVRDGPAFIGMPNAKTAGKIVSPVSRDTSVSRQTTCPIERATLISLSPI